MHSKLFSKSRRMSSVITGSSQVLSYSLKHCLTLFTNQGHLNLMSWPDVLCTVLLALQAIALQSIGKSSVWRIELVRVDLSDQCCGVKMLHCNSKDNRTGPCVLGAGG